MQRWRPFKPMRMARLVPMAKKFSGYILVMRPIDYVQYISPYWSRSQVPAWSIDFILWWLCRLLKKSNFSAWGKFYKYKTSTDKKKNHNWKATLFTQFLMSWQQFYRHLFYNDSLWEKCFLGHRGSLSFNKCVVQLHHCHVTINNRAAGCGVIVDSTAVLTRPAMLHLQNC